MDALNVAGRSDATLVVFAEGIHCSIVLKELATSMVPVHVYVCVCLEMYFVVCF